MDILATLVPTAAPAPGADNVVAEAPVALTESFSAVLSQVVAPVPQALPVVQAPVPVQPPVAVAPAPAAPVVVQVLPVEEPEVELPTVLADEPVAEVEVT